MKNAIASARLMAQTHKRQADILWAPITPEEEKQATPATIKILLLYTVLSLAVADIKFEFDEVGLYRQKTKKTINEVEAIVVRLFNRLRDRLKEDNPSSVKKYDNIYLYACDKVANAILLEAPERSVNIALACCRLMGESNDSIKRFCVPEVLPLHNHIVRRLETLPVKDYHIYAIIDRVIVKMIG